LENKNLSKQAILDCLHKWGHGVIESILDPSCHIFSAPGIEGLIGYHTNRGCAVAMGDPVCAPENREHLARAFHTFCAHQKKNVVYLAASEDFAKWMQEDQCSALISFGSELFLDPQRDPRQLPGKKAAALRRILKHAERAAICVKEHTDCCPLVQCQIEKVAHQWLQNRQGPQVYIAQGPLFDSCICKRWFYAEHNGCIIGCLALNRIEAKGGWALDRIMLLPECPQGTSEMLVVSVMEMLAQEGCRFLTVGPTNSKQVQTVSGFGKCSSFLVPRIYQASLKIFKLHRRGQYWEKFHPQSSPAFIVFKEPTLGLHEIRGLLRTLNISFRKKSKRSSQQKSCSEDPRCVA